jgi:lipoprotein-releasing system ATP-binding protein
MNNAIVLECRDLSKVFMDGKNQLQVLAKINLQIKRGAQVAIMGRSGSGKSTLLQLLGGLDQPSSGQVLLDDQDLLTLSEQRLSKLRNQAIGFVYQQHHLLAEFTALENIALPMLIADAPVKQAMAQAAQLLAAVGLSERAEHRPGQLSGGERQRVALARSLIMRPQIVLADEPTGNLDQESASKVLQLMQQLNHEYGTTLIVVTHDAQLAASLEHTYYLQDGKIGE